jgi:hypothetical protein
LKESLSALFRSDSLLFEITVPDMEAGSYSFTIYGIVNPAEGGTGSFIIESRRNQAYKVDINLLDFNYAFDQVGIIPTAKDLTNLKVTPSLKAIN